MRTTLLALAILSTFAATQNVLAFTPAGPAIVEPARVVSEAASRGAWDASAAALAGESEAPGSLGLLTAGLLGLTLAGNRRRAVSTIPT